MKVNLNARTMAAASRSSIAADSAAALLPQKLEAIAMVLEAHADYRVLRRLSPRRMSGIQPLAGTCAVLIVDVETTGLDSRRDRIIELGMSRIEVDSQTGRAVRVVDEYQGLEDPGVPIDARITRITGITDEMVRGKRLDERRIAEIARDATRGATQGAALVVAHNARFDRPFVEARIELFARLPWACSCFEIDWAAEDRSSAKLSSLAMENGWFFDGHRALEDCHAVLAVLDAPLPVSGGTGFARLLAAAREGSFRVFATAAPFEAKEALKARCYRWDAEARVWHTELRSKEAIAAERVWLKQNVYAGRAAKIDVEALDAWVRFSNRGGTVEVVRL